MPPIVASKDIHEVSQQWAKLAKNRPLVLLPLRLETRYEEYGPDRWYLKVRVYPDALHAKISPSSPADGERALGREFWQAGGGADAFAALAHACRSPWRALAIADATAPRKPSSPNAKPNAKPSADAPIGKATAALLPSRWIAVGTDRSGLVFTARGEPIPAALALHPEWAAMADESTPLEATSGLPKQDPARWLVDFDAAVAVGMAMRIELANARRSLKSLVVVGVRGDDDDAQQLAALFASHLRSDGLGLAFAGTPTNNDDDEPSGAAVEAAAYSVFTGRDGAATTSFSGSLLDADAGMALARALGLRDSPLPLLPLADTRPETMYDAAQTLVGMLGLEPWMATQFGASTSEAHEVGAWFSAWVRPDGPLPLLRVGPQPYGVLPVGPRREADATLESKIEAVLHGLRQYWAAAVDDVPRADSSAAASATDKSAVAGQLLAVLQRHPVPTACRVRDLEAAAFKPTGELPASIHATMRDLVDHHKALTDALKDIPKITLTIFRPQLEIPLTTLLAAKTLAQQIERAEQCVAALKNVSPPTWLAGNWRDNAATKVKALQKLLARAEEPERVLATVGLTAPLTGPLTADSPVVLEVAMKDRTDAWRGNLVGDDLGWIPALVKQLRDAVVPADPAPGAALWRQVTVLRARGIVQQCRALHLGEAAVKLARERRDRMCVALEALATCTPAKADALLRGALGTCIHRLDAWLAGLATARLSRALATPRRPAVPTGCIVGGYACVVDLKPVRRAAAGGHVLTPSLTHASMAALLRSGFAAYGDALGLGVDLSSERVRLARWLFDGVRQGRGLGELLGERFERRLHQLGAADLIPAFRTAVLAGLGQPDVPPHAIVDGFVLARARRAVWQTGQALDESERDVASKVGSVGAGRDAAKTALADLDAALDALADTSLADALHGLLEGDTDRVRATLEAVDRGKAKPPTLDGLGLQRGGFAVHHEVAVLLPEAAATPGPGLAVLVAPRIDAWLAGLLRVDQRFGLLAVDPAGVSPARPFQLTLAELGGGPLDLLALAPGGVLAGSPLERLLHAHLGDRGVPRDWRIDPLPPPAGVPALAELLAVVGWLQQTLARTSALGPAHLGASAGAPASLVDLGDPDDAVRHQRILERLAAITALASPGAPLPPHALAEARLVLTLLGDSARPLPAADDPGLRAWIAETAAPTLAQLRSGPATTASLRVRLGDWLPATRALQPAVAPSWLWTPTKGALCWATPAEQGPGVGQWLDLLGPTRPALGALSDVLLASEALGAPPSSPLAYQSPARPRWIGLGQPPPGTRSDTRSLVVLGARPGQPVGALSGLVIDGFTERIPETHTGGGLTFQWDAPAARAPQSILVVAPEEARAWSPDRVAAIVLDTIQLARERMVGPEELFPEPTAGLGRVLPALTLPDDIDTQPLAIAFAELFASAERITNIVPRTLRIDP